ncbi:unnamed protein product [Prorocentrum cordatum]|uniref:Hint domain-containing protein n=1 Tax=Prorocentrum cordatum TaxID=2364126 RepID=A0ABN9U3M2_9DINO|nr:unnamed protein product [Polarella glacialis]
MPAGALRQAAVLPLDDLFASPGAAPSLRARLAGYNLEEPAAAAPGARLPPRRGGPRTAFEDAGGGGAPAAGGGGDAGAAGGAGDGGGGGGGKDGGGGDKDGGGQPSGKTLTYTTPSGKKITVSGKSFNACVQSCKTADYSGSGGAMGMMGSAVDGGSQASIQGCATFCRAEFELFCFPGDSVVVAKNRGRVPLAELRVGDVVLAVRGWEGTSASPSLCYDPVIAFIHHEPDVEGETLQIRHSLGQVQLTANHLLFTQRQGGGGTVPALASEVRVGDRLLAPWVDGGFATPEVLEVKREWKRGFYAPLLEGGTLLVDGTAASCYAVPRNLAETPAYRRAAELLDGAGAHALCHASFLPMRLLWRMAHRGGLELGGKAALQAKGAMHPDGIHPYAWLMYVATSSFVA